MLKKGEHIEGVPAALLQLLDANTEAADFFGALSNLINRLTRLGGFYQNRTYEA